MAKFRRVGNLLPQSDPYTLDKLRTIVPRLTHITRMGYHFELLQTEEEKQSAGLWIADLKKSHIKLSFDYGNYDCSRYQSEQLENDL